MLNITNIINKFIKNSSQRELSSIKKLVDKINNLEPKVKEIADNDFPKKKMADFPFSTGLFR